MTKYEIKRFSSLERRLYDDSEKKKDSGFSWGKALGATAAVAGTMYGAKKGMFGNKIRRGYNTAYGHVGNALGSKSMIKSAASDYARGTNPQSRADFRKAYGEFNNKFDLTKGYKTTAPKTAKEAGMKTLDEIKNSSAAVSPAPVVKPVEPVQAVAPAAAPAAVSADTTAKAAVKNTTTPAAPSIFEAKKAEIKGRLGTYKNQGPTTIKEMNQETARREEMAKRSNYQQSKKRKKITAQEQQQRINNVQQTLGKNQYNSKNQNSKGFNAKKPEVPVAATANDYYNNPYNEYRMAAYSYSGVELKNQRFFSEKEDSSRKKKIRNAALLGAGTLALGATIYGIKKDKNKKKKIKELEETAKQGSKTIEELKKKKESVIANLKNSEKELEELHKKAKALANGEYKYTDKDLESFNKFMEDKNSVLHL